jgi:hypothetical protein
MATLSSNIIIFSKINSIFILVVCSDGWVKEKCLRNIDQLVNSILTLKSEQSQCILQLVCYPEPGLAEEAEPKDQETYIEGILRNLQIWTQRQSRMQLLFLFKYSDKVETDKIPMSTIGKFSKYFIYDKVLRHKVVQIPTSKN